MASNSFFESLILLWEEWELRLLVLTSLILQIILIGLGNRRKYSAGNKIAFVLWLAYLCADSIAIISLGILSRSQGNCSDAFVDLEYVMMAFWAPFLLLHLGGPDTITAYSLEDNELWLRHLLGLIVEVAVAIYIFVRSMKPTVLNFLAILIFIAGLIKYGERTWVLRSASSKQFRRSLLLDPDPDPNYWKFTEGYEPFVDVMPSPRDVLDHEDVPDNCSMSEGDTLSIAHKFFLIFRRLFTNLTVSYLTFRDLQESLPFFQRSNWEDAFKVVEMELGFMYDVLFTKATIVHHFWGGVLRSISFSSTAAALTAFCLIDLSGYSSVNVGITLTLLAGAIGLELYAIFGLLLSDWTMLWMNRNGHLRAERLISRLRSLSINKRWSNCVAQYNVLSSCLEDRTVRCCGLLNWIHEQLEDYQDDQMEPVSDYLKESVLKQLKEKSLQGGTAGFRLHRGFRLHNELCSRRGEWALKKYECFETLRWTIEVEFDQSIVLWHIATDLCLYDDSDSKNLDIASNSRREAVRVLSNYMLFILMKRPFMLPDGIGQIRLQDTCAEAEDFIQERKYKLDKSLVCKKLLEVDARISPINVKGDRGKSVLFDACRLAKSLRSLETGNQNKWEVMTEVWIEMLCYAACHCRWNHHAQQLRRGGELLTHVWILMTHLGISEQFEISLGHARTRPIVH